MTLPAILLALLVNMAPAQALKPDSVAPQLQPQNPSILELLGAEEPEDPAPAVSCEDAKKKSERCVPRYRFSDEVDHRSVKRLISWIDNANKAGADEILVELNTPGGVVDDGLDAISAIESSDAPVACVVDANAESMGFSILQSCAKRYIVHRGKLMTHEPSVGGGMRGTPNAWQSIADMIKATGEQLAWQCQHRLKISMKEYHAKVDGDKMWFMLPDEAKKVGAVDEIVENVKKLHEQMRKAKK